MNHLKTLFSSQAAKAWIAGLIAALAPYVVQWLSSQTAESVTDLFGRSGLQISEAGASAVVAIIGVVVVYFTRNKAA